MNKHRLKLSAFGNTFLGWALVVFGIVILTDFTLAKAILYVGAVIISAVLFL